MPAVMAPRVRNTIFGMPGIKPKPVRIAAVMATGFGLLNNWPSTCSPMSLAADARVTAMAAAVDKINEGICATSPSPMVNRV